MAVIISNNKLMISIFLVMFSTLCFAQDANNNKDTTTIINDCLNDITAQTTPTDQLPSKWCEPLTNVIGKLESSEAFCGVVDAVMLTDRLISNLLETSDTLYSSFNVLLQKCNVKISCTGNPLLGLVSLLDLNVDVSVLLDEAKTDKKLGVTLHKCCNGEFDQIAQHGEGLLPSIFDLLGNDEGKKDFQNRASNIFKLCGPGPDACWKEF